ncbi:hypothetical protein NUW54_g11020 [Trametes sanguinea]|uniref:Uncharacterized protein n=1 Tax=Trametes sanguinea TaxID=158606 RepID=A0ACC1NLZ9_9APHY|nr:hypothetical protein NUW54_g11020 [Trametes sanguinea]
MRPICLASWEASFGALLRSDVARTELSLYAAPSRVYRLLTPPLRLQYLRAVPVAQHRPSAHQRKLWVGQHIGDWCKVGFDRTRLRSVLSFVVAFMGREVMSAYRRRKYTTSVSPSPTRTSSATNSSMESLADTTVNLTPQRKHHKLLKDGSEVWSKEVEKIFVEGRCLSLSP